MVHAARCAAPAALPPRPGAAHAGRVPLQAIASWWLRVARVGALAAAAAAVALLSGARNALASAVPRAAGGADAAPLGLAEALKNPEIVSSAGLSVALLVAFGFFCMSETAITTLWPWKVRELADKEGEGSPFVLLQNDITRFLTTILLGSTVSSIGATALVTEVAVKVWGEQVLASVTVGLTGVMLMFCEIMPKSIAVQHATEVARFAVPCISFLAVILYPLGRACTWVSRTFLSVFGFKASDEPFVSEEELKLVLNGAVRSGALDLAEQDMIEDVLELKDTRVREVMTPLVDVVAIDNNATLDQLRETWVEHKFSRVPVYEERIDNIVGIVHALKLVRSKNSANTTVGDLVKDDQPYFVPEVMSTWNLLREFRNREMHLAVVVNEQGGITGIVTMEDAIMEIIGGMDSDVQHIVQSGSQSVWDVDCRAAMDELGDSLGVEFPEEAGYETASGYVCTLFERIPIRGESIIVDLPSTRREEGPSCDLESGPEGAAADLAPELNGIAADDDDDSDGARTVRMRITVMAADARCVRMVRMRKLFPGEPDVVEPIVPAKKAPAATSAASRPVGVVVRPAAPSAAAAASGADAPL